MGKHQRSRATNQIIQERWYGKVRLLLRTTPVLSLDEATVVLSYVTLARLPVTFTVDAHDVPVLLNRVRDMTGHYSVEGCRFSIEPPDLNPYRFDFEDDNPDWAEYLDELSDIVDGK